MAANKDDTGKRGFYSTPEPQYWEDAPPLEEPFFVIQEHQASSRHFVFRISIGGALASWAVPEGPSADPSEERLAIRTKDHPLGYADFEGAIPEDQYGGGEVIVWDRGPVDSQRNSINTLILRRARLDAPGPPLLDAGRRCSFEEICYNGVEYPPAGCGMRGRHQYT